MVQGCDLGRSGRFVSRQEIRSLGESLVDNSEDAVKSSGRWEVGDQINRYLFKWERICGDIMGGYWWGCRMRVDLCGLTCLTSSYVLTDVAVNRRPPQVPEYLLHHHSYSGMSCRSSVMILSKSFSPKFLGDIDSFLIFRDFFFFEFLLFFSLYAIVACFSSEFVGETENTFSRRNGSLWRFLRWALTICSTRRWCFPIDFRNFYGKRTGFEVLHPPPFRDPQGYRG